MTPEIDTRVIALLLWGGGVVFAYSIVLIKRLRRFHRHRNDRRRSMRIEVRRDVLAGFALFLTALGSGAAIALVLFGEAGTGPRGFLVALALGAYFGAGWIMATEEDSDGYGEADTNGPGYVPPTYDPAGDH